MVSASPPLVCSFLTDAACGLSIGSWGEVEIGGVEPLVLPFVLV